MILANTKEDNVMNRPVFDAKKAVEVLLYITIRSPNMYNALKVLYFADKEHLVKYGRLICGDSYVAMSKGPVPSGTYDLVKYIREGSILGFDNPAEGAFEVDGFYIHPLREVDKDYLSESDIECLDEAIRTYGDMAFGQLMDQSHDDAWHSADQNDFISLGAIVRTLPKADELLEYIQG